jgi:phosphoribosylamine--glycine ligase
MKVMVVGSGGREHALVWKLRKDRCVREVLCCPGNAGIAELAECVPVQDNDADGLASLAAAERVDLVVFGPEEPLVNGVGDVLRSRGVTVFGPSRAASRLEGSKVFAKLFMERRGVPTASFSVFESHAAASRHIADHKGRVVVKADGLARGKGVMVCADRAGAEEALRAVMVERQFGESGEKVLIEEYLEGEEVSVMAISDGENYALLPVSQDHKRVFDGDRGPNTGGMGAYCPVPSVGDELLKVIESRVMKPVLEGMAAEGAAYSGVLYAGLMLTESGPKTLEFNCRFGDPEAQALLPATDVNLGETLLAAARGELGSNRRLESLCHSVCVVLASGGYPGDYKTGQEIVGIEELKGDENVVLFHSGTARRNGKIVTAGGRVLGVTGMGASLEDALSRAYGASRRVQFNGVHYRKDIGARALKASSDR